MPIKIPDRLPARQILEAEGLCVMTESRAARQDIRPLRIAFLNLMPDKVRTETQFARLLGATPLQVDLTLVRVDGHVPRNAEPAHMAAFYRPWSEVRSQRFDGFVITGAPVEHLPFEEVWYWDAMRRMLDWSQVHAHRTLAVCWAAQAALRHFHGVRKHALPRKAFGVFPQRVLMPAIPCLRGFPDEFGVPVSRRASILAEELPAGLSVGAGGGETGPCLVDDPANGVLNVLDHFEYDSDTLAREHARDATGIPFGYYPGDDPALEPVNTWRGSAHLLVSNWIAEIYATAPFDLGESGPLG